MTNKNSSAKSCCRDMNQQGLLEKTNISFFALASITFMHLSEFSQDGFMLMKIVITRWPCHKGSQNSSCRPHRCCLRQVASLSLCHPPCNVQTHWRTPRQTACRPQESGSASGAPSHRQNTPRWWHKGPLVGGRPRRRSNKEEMRRLQVWVCICEEETLACST